jgi:hypothetical protein
LLLRVATRLGTMLVPALFTVKVTGNDREATKFEVAGAYKATTK